jgi:hypothetical protein
MLTMNIFNSLHTLLAETKPHDRDLRLWATTEFKHDADYAYTTVKATGKMPEVGVQA